jgi:hypothetical protein
MWMLNAGEEIVEEREESKKEELGTGDLKNL